MLLVWPREREPEYSGIPLSAWLTRFYSSNLAESASGENAVREMGTNILPTLTRWIQYEPSSWRKRLWGSTRQVPRSLYAHESVRLLFLGKGVNRANLAEAGFKILGPAAKDALPDLQRLANKSEAPYTQSRAKKCMKHVVRFLPPEDEPRNPQQLPL
jgi:hypothetical protein